MEDILGIPALLDAVEGRHGLQNSVVQDIQQLLEAEGGVGKIEQLITQLLTHIRMGLEVVGVVVVPVNICNDEIHAGLDPPGRPRRMAKDVPEDVSARGLELDGRDLQTEQFGGDFVGTAAQGDYIS